ncbi:hypothetical protein DFH09DRAFT_1307897 [Mycena vulgaris]|nr:hypothetical protein DFH09DRAFT_1331341 [Mycena vulgaris]KAJ6587688.1 hypothetical protein DFH09DRAFT_1307897 [Mycena vulgaris]
MDTGGVTWTIKTFKFRHFRIPSGTLKLGKILFKTGPGGEAVRSAAIEINNKGAARVSLPDIGFSLTDGKGYATTPTWVPPRHLWIFNLPPNETYQPKHILFQRDDDLNWKISVRMPNPASTLGGGVTLAFAGMQNLNPKLVWDTALLADHLKVKSSEEECQAFLAVLKDTAVAVLGMFLALTPSPPGTPIPATNYETEEGQTDQGVVYEDLLSGDAGAWIDDMAASIFK